MTRTGDEQLVRWARLREQMRSAKFLRWAGGLIGIGLLLQVATLFWSHPLAFVLFLVIGAGPVGLGILLFLAFLVQVPVEPVTSTDSSD